MIIVNLLQNAQPNIASQYSIVNVYFLLLDEMGGFKISKRKVANHSESSELNLFLQIKGLAEQSWGTSFSTQVVLIF